MGRLNAEHPDGVYGTYGTDVLGCKVPIRKTEIREFGPGKRVLFQDGTSGEYDAVLLNTGYTKTCFDLYADMVATTSVSRRFCSRGAQGCYGPVTWST
eukprot:scaffold34560_cov64-Phaeocystis_antarctica.AAC.7